ncbi:MAG: hypothetical protein ACM3QZ_00970 [Solirubrobacterales bacterium]
MNKRGMISVFLAMALCLGMVVGIGVTTAQAAATYTVLSTPTVSNGTGKTLGTIRIDMPNLAAFVAGDKVTFYLPSGVSIPSWGMAAPLNPAEIEIISADESAIPQSSFRAYSVGPNAFDIDITDSQLGQRTGSGALIVNLRGLTVTNPGSEIYCTILAPAASGFSSGAVLVARWIPSGTSAAISSVNELDRNRPGQPIGTIALSETAPGALQKGDSITFRLPEGCSWDGGGMSVQSALGFSQLGSGALQSSISGNTMIVTMAGDPSLTTSAGQINIIGAAISTTDSAASGDVVCQITGTGYVTAQSLTVARVKQAQQPAMFTVLKAGTVQSGDGKYLGLVQVDIPTPWAIDPGTMLFISLPSNITLPHYAQGAALNPSDISITVPQQVDATVTNAITTGMLSATMASPTLIEVRLNSAVTDMTNPGRFFIEFNSLNVASGQTGDIAVNMFGPPMSVVFPGQQCIIGKVNPPVSPDVIPMARSVVTVDRSSNQPLDTILLQESVPGSITKDSVITLTLPLGYTWSLSGATALGGWNFSDLGANAWNLSSSGNALTVTLIQVPSSQTSEGRVYLNGLRINVPASAPETEIYCTVTCSGMTTTKSLMIAKMPALVQVSAQYSVSGALAIKNDKNQCLGSLFIDLPVTEALRVGDTLTIAFPSGVTFAHYKAGRKLNPADCVISVNSGHVSGRYMNHATIANYFSATMTAPNVLELKVALDPTTFRTGPCRIQIQFKKMDVSGQNGTIPVTLTASSGGAVFTNGSVTLGTIIKNPQIRRTPHGGQ